MGGGNRHNCLKGGIASLGGLHNMMWRKGIGAVNRDSVVFCILCRSVLVKYISHIHVYLLVVPTSMQGRTLYTFTPIQLRIRVLGVYA